ncbi:MAG: enoyl-CoA hydratase/isomerase family protein [Gammaproteobacteria bacterium]|nr:enoyl-CoA hydratase/isomerase family protein [Gammaproteobacteria bacterium]
MIEAATESGVCRLTLQRAQVGNALDAAVVELLLAAVDEALADRDVHTLAIGGAGKHFCTGFDLSDLEASSDGDLLQRFVRIETLLQLLWHAPIRTVAIAQGRTFGAGADLLACCDVRIAAAGTTFAFPGARFGLVLGTRRLAERVGTDRARRIVTEGESLKAEAALACGFVTALGGEEVLAALPAPVAERETVAQLRAATREDHRDADLAALVRSAARPGVKARIADYVRGLRAS